MEQIECSETSAIINQTPGNHPKEDVLNSKNGESLKSSSYKHVSNFLWMWRYSCLKLARTPVHFCLWGWTKSEVNKEKVNTRDELVTSFMNSAALIKQGLQDDLRRAKRTTAKRVEK
jgi:hypothetical protein